MSRLVFAAVCSLLLFPVVALCTSVNTSVVSGVWTKSNSPYHIKNDIEIPDDSILRIEPGVEVVFDGHYKLQVKGALIAKGAVTDSIYFLPADTAGGWRGVQVDNSNLGANGVMNDNDSTIIDYCVLRWARNTGDNYYRGSAFYLREYSKVSIVHSSFRNNYSMVKTPSDGSGKGAGMFLRDTRATVAYCEFLDNHVIDDGGALYADNAGTISNCVFKYNTAYEDGGGIAVFYGARFEDCLIDSNTATTEEGGGIHAEHGVEVIGCTITNNKAGKLGSGGGVYMLYEGTIAHCIIENNYCGKSGGGVYATDKGSVSYSVINANDAYEGGGVFFNSAPTNTDPKVVFGCKVQNNTAKVAGGVKSINTYVINCVVSNNKATVLGPGFRGETSNVINCTIVNNEGPGGGGVSSKGRNNLLNTVVYKNTEPQVKEDFTGLVVQNCAIGGAADKSNYISSVDLSKNDPHFVLPVSFTGTAGNAQQLAEIQSADWHPAQSSPLINYGDNSLFVTTYGSGDIDSNDRIQKGKIDIGAYESTYNGLSVNDQEVHNQQLNLTYNTTSQQIIPAGNFSYGILTVISIEGGTSKNYRVYPGDVLSVDDYRPGVFVAILEADGETVCRKIIRL